MKDDFRLFFVAEQQDVINLGDGFYFLPDFLFKKLEVLLRVISFGVEESLDDSDFLQLSQILHVFLLGISVIMGEVDETDQLLEMRIGELGLDHFKVVLSEVPQLHHFIEMFLQI